MNRRRVERLVGRLLVEIGEDPGREGLRATPAGYAQLISAFSAGGRLPGVASKACEAGKAGRMVVVRGIPFLSLCEHHLLPFFGHVDVGYAPDGRSCDPSALAEAVDGCARRLQLQERLTEEIADALLLALRPAGVAVACEGHHFCMMMRGVGKQNSEIRTSSLRGSFLEPSARRSFFATLRQAERSSFPKSER